MLKFCEEEDMSDVPSSHVCDLCSHATIIIGEKEVSILQELPEKVEDISHMYLASYVAFKHLRLHENREDFNENITAFNEMNRGKLSYHTDLLQIPIRTADSFSLFFIALHIRVKL